MIDFRCMEKCIQPARSNNQLGRSSALVDGAASYNHDASEKLGTSEQPVGTEHINADCASPLLRAFSRYFMQFPDAVETRDSSRGAQV